jgi:glutamate synthase (NADPH/NADH) small chain
VGSGPAGLSFAGDMAKMGYDVTVFEALHEIGGVLKYGIPEFRLPNKIVDVEIENLSKMGVTFVKDCIIGKTISVEDLESEGFKGIFVASGAGLPNFMNIPGENSINIMSSNEYLTRVNLMDAASEDADTPVTFGKRVAVIGGGNTAMDSVRTARRLGAEKAMIIYRRSEAEMPARLEEVKHAKEEGVEFLTLHNPIEYIADEKGRVKQVVLQKMELGEPDASGRRSPVAIPGATVTLDIDMAIVSVGVSPNPIVPNSIPGLELGRKGTIAVNDDMQSSIPTIYAGGDIVRGGATVILAMGDGRRAAAAMDRQLRHLQDIEKGRKNPSYDVLASFIKRLGISANELFYPDASEQEKQVQHFMGKFLACTEDERQIILKTLDCMAEQFISRRYKSSDPQNYE